MFENCNSDVPICPHCREKLDAHTCLPGCLSDGYTQEIICRFCDKRFMIKVNIKKTYTTTIH